MSDEFMSMTMTLTFPKEERKIRKRKKNKKKRREEKGEEWYRVNKRDEEKHCGKMDLFVHSSVLIEFFVSWSENV